MKASKNLTGFMFAAVLGIVASFAGQRAFAQGIDSTLKKQIHDKKDKH